MTLGGERSARSASRGAGRSGSAGGRDGRRRRDDILCAEKFSDDAADEGPVCGLRGWWRNDVGYGGTDAAAFEAAGVTRRIRRRRRRNDGGRGQIELGSAGGIVLGRGDGRGYDGEGAHLHTRGRNFPGHGGRRGRDHAAVEGGSGASLVAGDAGGSRSNNGGTQSGRGAVAVARDVWCRSDDAGIEFGRVERVFGGDAGRGRDDGRVQRGSPARSTGGNVGSGRNNRSEGEAAAGLIAGHVGGGGCDHVGGEAGCGRRRVQTFGGRNIWRTGSRCDRLEGEKVGDGSGRRREV